MNDNMTWEETIQHIRKQPEYRFLVEKAYFEEQLSLNVERYRESEEYKETLQKIRQTTPNAKRILDIGSGNGITAISFALDGYDVVTVEPDPSQTIGAGAIRQLKEEYRLSNIQVYEAFAEEINFKDGEFDIVFARQCMHHAYDLKKFVAEMSRVLKQGGMFFTVRDHVIFDEADKVFFLENHPLQKYYGGENAFTPQQYTEAIETAGLTIVEVLKYFDSVINYFPEESKTIARRKKEVVEATRFGKLLWYFPSIRDRRANIAFEQIEKNIPGRMYSYIAIKK